MKHETVEGLYDWKSFVPAVILSEIPWTALTTILLFVICYWSIGLSMNIGIFLLGTFIFQLYCVSFGQSVVGFAPSLEVAALIASLCTTIMPVTSGIPTPYKVMASMFKNSIYWISPYHYYSSILMTSQFNDLPVVCTPDELTSFVSPGNLTCQAYMKPYFEAGGPGYLVEGGGECQFCPLVNGTQFLTYQLSWSIDTLWRDLGILWVLMMMNWIGICLWLYLKTRR